MSLRPDSARVATPYETSATGRLGIADSLGRHLQGKLKSAGNSRAELFVVTGGTPAPHNPCRSGYHMYLGVASEAAKGIDHFARKYLQSTAP